MADLPDEVQREFEVSPDRKLLSICIIRRHLIQAGIYFHKDRITDRVLNAITYWLRSLDTKPGQAKCLDCGATLMLPGLQSEAYAVALPTAKMYDRGRVGAMIGSFCAKCSTRSDDELNDIAHKHWAPTSIPLAEGNA